MARTSLTRGTSELISYLKYSPEQIQHHYLAVIPKHCVAVAQEITHKKRPRSKRPDCSPCATLLREARLWEAELQLPGTVTALRDVTETPLKSTEALFEKSLIAAYCWDTPSTQA